MADDKGSSGDKNGFLDNYGILIIVIMFILASSFFVNGGIFNSSDEKDDTKTVLTEKKRDFTLSISKILGKSNIELGDSVIALEDLTVRVLPGGSILGLQKKLAKGKVMEGPISQFDTYWFRVNFENAPSGWVEYDSISNKISTINSINFPLILYKGFKPIGWILSIFLILVVLFYKFKLTSEKKITDKKRSVKDELAEKNKKEKEESKREELGLSNLDQYKNSRWEHVKTLMQSKNQSDWRQAIIEADIILDEMLRRMGYDGLTIGDMLKQIEPSDFANLEKAWEAHKFRNEIAHTGSEFKLSKEEAERIVDLFRAIFEEFYYI